MTLVPRYRYIFFLEVPEQLAVNFMDEARIYASEGPFEAISRAKQGLYGLLGGISLTPSFTTAPEFEEHTYLCLGCIGRKVLTLAPYFS